MTTTYSQGVARGLAALAIALISLIALISQSGPAAAQAAKPAPGCQGLAIEDPKGDAADADRFDITGAFFLYDGETLTANIKVADYSDGSAAFPALEGNWYFEWDVDGATRYVSASSAGGPPVFSYGTLEGNLYSTEGDTTGTVYPGPDGIISIVVPAGSGGAEGAVLKAPIASTKAYVGVPGVLGSLQPIDDAPDSGGGTDYSVQPCVTAGGGSNELGVTMSTSAQKASKAKKGKSLSFKLFGNASNLKATLKKGKKSFGSGKLATLATKGTIKVKLKKALKKGSYTLDLAGTNADGNAASATFKFKVK